MEDQLLEKQQLRAINLIKNVSKRRVTADHLPGHLKNRCIGTKGSINDVFTLAENEDGLSNQNDTNTSPIVSYFKFKNIVTNADSHANFISTK